MNSLNSILLEGNLTRDPELRTTPAGTPVCVFNMAVNRFYRQNHNMEKETSYFDVETWSRLAESCGEMLTKGRGVRVVGRLKQDRWTDAEGKMHARVKIVAEHVEFKPRCNKSPITGEETPIIEPEPAQSEDTPNVEAVAAV